MFLVYAFVYVEQKCNEQTYTVQPSRKQIQNSIIKQELFERKLKTWAELHNISMH